MQPSPTQGELEERIRRDLDHFNGNLPERSALVWHGYLAALIEWGLISPGVHGHLTAMLPLLPDNPAVDILLGREEK
jgi:hypothetical protein